MFNSAVSSMANQMAVMT